MQMSGGLWVIWPIIIILLCVDFYLLKKLKEKDSEKIKIISIIVMIFTILIPIYQNTTYHPMIREMKNGIGEISSGYYEVRYYTNIYGMKIFEQEEDW